MTTDALARLREQVRRLERRNLPHSHADTLPTGHSAVDDHLGGGLRTGSLHDFLISDPLETGASLAMLLPVLKEGRGPVFWISDTPAALNACGLHQSGVSPDHLVCIETDPANLLSVAEDILRGPERALAVIAGRHVPTLKEIRRLNLAVEASGNTGFFLRSAPLAQAPGKDPCACATRWRILSHPSSPQTLPGLAMPLPGSRRLSAAVLRVRGGRPAHWILDCTDHAPLSRSLDALLAHRAPPALPPGRLPDRQAARCAHAVTGVSPAALAAGLTPGMPLTQARSLIPDLLSAEEDAEAQRAALTDLCSWLIWLSPLPAFDAPDGLYSDTTGCAHLYGGEAAMLDLVKERLKARGHSCSVALSDTAAASRALARSGIDQICLVPPGQQKQALHPLPCSALPLPEKTLSSLTRLGLNTIGALADLPRAPLAKRFGAQLLTCLDEALGRQASPLNVFHPADRISLTRSLVEPISTPDAIAAVIAALVPVVCEKLTARGEGARQLDFLCVRVNGSIQAVRVGTSDPTADVTRLMRLLGDQIPQIAPEFGIETVILTVSANEPLEAGPERSVLPDAVASSERALPATLIDRLLNRPGVVSVHQFAPRFSAWPEDGQSRISPGDVAESTNASQMLWARPNILFDLPVRVQVTALLPDGAPRQFVLKRQTHRIAAADGPERLLGDWW